MKGGVILFRGNGAAARRHIEGDRSRADECYLGADDAVAEYAVLDASGEVATECALSADGYEDWVAWINPETGESMRRPRQSGGGRKGPSLFAEMVINIPQSLSIAGALHPEVSEALDAAQREALSEIRRRLGHRSVTRADPRGKVEVVPIEYMQVVGIGHKTSRTGDPHRHIQVQIGSSVRASGKWRALDAGASFALQGAIRALSTSVIAASPQLVDTLAKQNLTLNHATGEIAELEQFNGVMSKRSAQIAQNLRRFEMEAEPAHPAESQRPGALIPVPRACMGARPWTLVSLGVSPSLTQDSRVPPLSPRSRIVSGATGRL